MIGAAETSAGAQLLQGDSYYFYFLLLFFLLTLSYSFNFWGQFSVAPRVAIPALRKHRWHLVTGRALSETRAILCQSPQEDFPMDD